jgi:hypothetical protein
VASLAEQLTELRERLKKVEENQQAIEGAIRAFIVVYGVRRIPDGTGDGTDEH